MTLRSTHYPAWGLAQRSELVATCRGLPILTRAQADAFFDTAERASTDSRQPAETLADSLFNNLGSTIAASDRQDFDVRVDPESEGIVGGVLMVETYDPVIATLQCVARVGDDSFLTRTFSFDDVEPVKDLWTKQGL
jgi:hypothetical protein